MTTPELLPCPRCDGQMRIASGYLPNFGMEYHWICTKCLNISPVSFTSKESAILDANRRAPTPSTRLREAAEKVKEGVQQLIDDQFIAEEDWFPPFVAALAEKEGEK